MPAPLGAIPAARPYRLEVALLAVTFALGFVLVLAMPVFAQEAYYWTYAQHLDLSYFDHPPMVAWLIWLGTHVFGDGHVGVRFGTFLCGIGTTLLGLSLLRRFGADARARATWIVLGLAVPLYAMGHFFANPDPPLILGWAAVMVALWRVREGGGLGWWVLAGTAAGWSLLSKYTALFLAIGGVLFMLWDPVMRRQWRKPGPYLAVLVSAALFLPVVIWNVEHDFASFRFQTGERYEHATLGLGWMLQFVGGQTVVYHPAMFLLLPLVLHWLGRRARAGDARMRLLLAFGVPLPAFFLANSLFVQVKMNWLLPAYLPLLVGSLLWCRETAIAASHPRLARWVRRSVLGAAVLAMFAPLVQVLPQGGGSSWTGWEEVARRAEHWETELDGADAIEGNVFFFASGYRDAAQLGRGLHLHIAELKRTTEPDEVLEPILAQNVVGEPSLQFDYWNAPYDWLGKDAIFVLLRPDQRAREVDKARACFHDIQKVERKVVERLGIVVMVADIYLCHDYLGPLPGKRRTG